MPDLDAKPELIAPGYQPSARDLAVAAARRICAMGEEGTDAYVAAVYLLRVLGMNP